MNIPSGIFNQNEKKKENFVVGLICGDSINGVSAANNFRPDSGRPKPTPPKCGMSFQWYDWLISLIVIGFIGTYLTLMAAASSRR
jgi:hypothetical protein